ncbi:exocyst complex component 3-like protein [Callorhinchus milii]|nr:exocyst complex component 3-like protein [Callorhinchus milii]
MTINCHCEQIAATRGMSAQDGSLNTKDAPWPEFEKAEKLARGAALKWASGMFYHPDQLERLSQYRKRESQRTSSIQTRLKSAVHSYLEGVGIGIRHLRASLDDIGNVCETLVEVREDWQSKLNSFQSLRQLSSLVSEHVQLATAVHNLQQVLAVPEVVMETHQLIEQRRLLEAHTKLMELECWRDSILYQLNRAGQHNSEGEQVVLSYFSGVGQLNEELAKELWDVITCGLTLVKQDPALFVSAIRIIEREERIDQIILEGQSQHKFLPLGRPKNLRRKVFHVLERSTAAQFRARQTDTKGPGLANHLGALQNNILNDLKIVKDLMVQCCPPHYNILQTYVMLHHKCLSGHLQDIISWDLEKNEIYTVLNWILHVYHSPEMMAHPDLCPDVDVSALVPLISQDAQEQLQNKYVNALRVSVSDWMQKALDAEVNDWYRDEEPESDHEGYFHSSLPVIVTQMLEENVQVAAEISPALRDQVVIMALQELETFLYRFREAVIDFGREHSTGRSQYYLLYLLAAVNNCIVLSEAYNYPREGKGTEDQAQCFSIKLRGKTDPESHRVESDFLRQLISESGSPSVSVEVEKILPKIPITQSVHWLQDHYGQAWAGERGGKLPHVETTLDKVLKKGCRLLIDRMLSELQPLFLQLLACLWMGGSDFIDGVCTVLDTYYNYFSRIREPIFQFLLVEGLRLLIIEYVQTLMLKKMVCKNPEEREKVSERMSRDSVQLRAIFHKLGLDDCDHLTSVISSVSELLRLTDTSLLGLEVSGLVTKYPDISDEHVSVLLDIRGDVSKDVRGTVLEMLEQNTQLPPEDYQPIFTDIVVPAPALPFCLPAVRCA